MGETGPDLLPKAKIDTAVRQRVRVLHSTSSTEPMLVADIVDALFTAVTLPPILLTAAAVISLSEIDEQRQFRNSQGLQSSRGFEGHRDSLENHRPKEHRKCGDCSHP